MPHEMDLEKDVEVKYVDNSEFLEQLALDDTADLREPFEFILPIQAKTVKWRMLRGKDERSVDKYVRRMHKRVGKGARTDERKDYEYRLALRISEVDGQKLDIHEALEFIGTLRGKDALAIRQEIELIDFGIDLEFDVNCRGCGYENDVLMPLDRSFFRPQRRVA
jgi:hypothetical protein